MNSLERLLIQKPIILQLLRFAAIGVLNTTIDFIILNFASKALGITSGFQLGTLNIFGFIAALIQSYFWNRYWAFDAGQTTEVIKNFIRLVIVGGIGAVGFIGVLVGAQMGAAPFYYIVMLGLFLVAEVIAWTAFGLGRGTASVQPSRFTAFALVSIVGLLINSALVAVVSHYLANNSAFANPDLLKNAAKIAATCISLIWNFIGYKLIVFKR